MKGDNAMRSLRKKHPMIVSIVLLILFLIAQILISLPLTLLDPDWILENLYAAQLAAEVFTILVMLLASRILGLRGVFQNLRGRTTFAQRLVPCLPLLLLYLYTGVGELVLSPAVPLQPPLQILFFVLCMLSVGIAEELTFRGLITRILYEHYGQTRLGMWLSILFSSLLFGLMHLTNAVSGAESGGVLVQVAAAMCLGICLGAIYLRTGSLWTVSLLHGFMDFCGLLTSGIFQTGSPMDMIGEYGLSQLLVNLAFVLVAVILLRPAKIRDITDRRAIPPTGHVVTMTIVLMLCVGLYTAVLVSQL